MNLTSKLIVPLYFWYPFGAASSTIAYISVASADVISFSFTISRIPSLFVWTLALSTAPATVNTAGFCVIGVTPSFLVFTNFTS